ncbi:homocysteine S-methyltransferase family protein [Methylorubrum extorquens]|uniref:Homocysteine S-methyltransferase n=1 Tax=Methylorubrum extorquens (strain CM4 / NCIMB 13688) TaxID=440085 RepID=B7L1F1_METC4|nr:homocysteine S-methyltransferase family protein [Methylorubrum extorquens]ACK81045.1 homocysteine S-methyltransferase [Methylorubrum extorquens CM4]
MPRYRTALPQLDGHVFLTDGGLETTLVFHEGLELTCFAAFPLVCTEEGRDKLTHYFQPYLDLAEERQLGFILDTPTWRANPDWGAQLGFTGQALTDVSRAAVTYLEGLRRRHAHSGLPIVLNGVIGPRGDGYKIETSLTAAEAATYHGPQIQAFRDTEADMVSAITMTSVEEAIGIAWAAQTAGMPVVISFTVETNGRLPSGQALGSAIEEADGTTGAYPAYYMINCAHPTHFKAVLVGNAPWLNRIRGLRANASAKSHAELDVASELDIGDPQELGLHYADLCARLRSLKILGGCCGTDRRHVAAICDACL